MCAMAFAAYTMLLFHQEVDYWYLGFLGSATILIYSIHRIIGIKKVGDFITTGRFAIINRYRHHLVFYVFISLIVASWCVVHLSVEAILWCAFPASIALFYVVPIFPRGRRLRDYSYVKILLVGFSWAWFVAFMPSFQSEDSMVIYLSRFLFVIGITIPFDIRDAEVDAYAGVKTIAHLVKPKIALWLAIIMVLLSFTLVLFMSIDSTFLTIELMVHLITIYLIYKSIDIKNDDYYSFVMDGTMGLFLIGYILAGIFPGH
jgi:4-hydroxybenzoate polyprenyltransferase